MGFKLGMIGAIIGIMISIVFKDSANIITLAPAAGAIGALIGTIIHRRKEASLKRTE